MFFFAFGSGGFGGFDAHQRRADESENSSGKEETVFHNWEKGRGGIHRKDTPSPTPAGNSNSPRNAQASSSPRIVPVAEAKRSVSMPIRCNMETKRFGSG